MGMNLKKYLITGIAAVVPLAATLYILRYLIELIDGISQPVVVALLGRNIPGLGFLITLAILLLAGIFVSYAVGREVAEFLDNIMLRIPLSRGIYSIIKNISDTFLSSNREFGQVVLIKFMPDVYSLGFLAGKSPPEVDDATSLKLLNVFVPTSPNPTTGVLFMVPQERIMPLDMSVDRGIQIIVSAGFLGSESDPAKPCCEPEPDGGAEAGEKAPPE
jgi:uncharacterized membrane protein